MNYIPQTIHAVWQFIHNLLLLKWFVNVLWEGGGVGWLASVKLVLTILFHQQF